MKLIQSLITSSLLVLFSASIASAETPKNAEAEATRAEIKKTLGFVPALVKAVPDSALAGAWLELTSLEMNPNTAVPPKYKELLGIAVAAQIPCDYCVYGHTEFAKLHGATDEEIGEAVAVAAIVRHWSAVANGLMIDEAKIRAEMAKIVAHLKQAKTAPVPAAVVDAQSTYQEIEQSIGFVPEMFKLFPEVAVAGAWRETRDVSFNPNSAIPQKYKELIALGVAAQVPCRYCTIAHTEMAKVAGANEPEIREAVALAAVVRHWSTLLNGRQVDKNVYRKEIDKIVAQMKKQMLAARDSK